MQHVIMLLQTQKWQLTNKKLILPIVLFALLCVPLTYDITKAVLSDAFWQVSAYVAATLISYHFINLWLANKSWLHASVNKSAFRQVVFASLLGALPGCGGAIIVVTQFVRKQMSFGALVAVLTATMGDAAFLLLATKPTDGFIMMLLGTTVGTLSGIIINKIHGNDFMRPTAKHAKKQRLSDDEQSPFAVHVQGQFWRFLCVPTFIVALMASFQMDINAVLHLPEGTIETVGMMLALVSTVLWALSHNVFDYQSTLANTPKQEAERIFEKAAQDTNFVSSWVIIAFLSFELTVFFTGLDLSVLFSNYLLLIPLIAAIIGLLPGCGPQILVTSLYIQGIIPFSAQIANGLSNDGDALFPAIALAPKAALVATIYSIIPAIIVSYAYLIAFE